VDRLKTLLFVADDLLAELAKDPAARFVELLNVHNLMEHDRASRNADRPHTGALPVRLKGNNDAILVDALLGFDPALQCVLSAQPPAPRTVIRVTAFFREKWWCGLKGGIS
jgi:hypothetical protein